MADWRYLNLSAITLSRSYAKTNPNAGQAQTTLFHKPAKTTRRKLTTKRGKPKSTSAAETFHTEEDGGARRGAGTARQYTHDGRCTACTRSLTMGGTPSLSWVPRRYNRPPGAGARAPRRTRPAAVTHRRAARALSPGRRRPTRPLLAGGRSKGAPAAPGYSPGRPPAVPISWSRSRSFSEPRLRTPPVGPGVPLLPPPGRGLQGPGARRQSTKGAERR